ncbi:MAG TPA: hypothetical protein VH475_16145 [Tepidisphaeraceae bacterium]|jgi:hypothetical protein
MLPIWLTAKEETMSNAGSESEDAVARRRYRRWIVLAALGFVGLAWVCAPRIHDWWLLQQEDSVTVSVVNETNRPLQQVVVTGDMGFSLPLGDLATQASVTKAARFGPTQGRGRLKFHDGTAFTEFEIGYLLNDDGPYEINVTIRPTTITIHRECPTDQPATWTVERDPPAQ